MDGVIIDANILLSLARRLAHYSVITNAVYPQEEQDVFYYIVLRSLLIRGLGNESMLSAYSLISDGFYEEIFLGNVLELTESINIIFCQHSKGFFDAFKGADIVVDCKETILSIIIRR